MGDKLFCRYRQRQADTFYYEDPETAARPPYSHRFTMSTPQHVLVAKGTVRLAGKTNHSITVADQDFLDEGSQIIILAKYFPKIA